MRGKFREQQEKMVGGESNPQSGGGNRSHSRSQGLKIALGVTHHPLLLGGQTSGLQGGQRKPGFSSPTSGVPGSELAPLLPTLNLAAVLLTLPAGLPAGLPAQSPQSFPSV